ncbi:MAG: DNA polymerase III subunit gamma/tau [Gemella haemolysans]|jgi:DNA polymerase III, subunit gamma and tau|uniref:DNA polymerase III subunit gamma/tau n=1 Tax=Gemella haemolysans TaxID=1379 RepID=UPI000C800671|nr:DNA polymerase III subunit gamma/tau [Gemella haemolysans]MDU6572668.1 DNA polymerase III subunit gamma/tau [Gemella haemolysans]PMC48807.1 DNA polymerase III subunit gamma/tau [Streptococcus sp. UMB1385]
MFQALYRKYRPQTFADIVGQNHIVSVLKNAIDKDQISHAYLFYGSRGTGKTSIAKIFANEVNRNEEYQKENVDIIEIDAASNNGVDEVRDIKEAIKFLPTEGKYKVYIIDEVHMLTTAAFNALLKTLEEPPAHVIFILATTEIHKIPATILSRCQRFEFKSLSQEQLIDRLKYISEKESLVIEDAAIEKIATLAKGGLRDAISILDQVSNYSEEITLNHILEVTSSISEDDILEFYRNLLQGDVTKSLLIYNNFVSQAKDTKLLLNDLINVTRDVVVYKNLKDTKHTAYNIDKIADEVNNISFDYFYKIIEYLSQTEQYIRFSTEYMSYMQICIVKICSKEDSINQGTVANSVEKTVSNTRTVELENKIKILEDKLNQLGQNLSSLSVNSINNTSHVETQNSTNEEVNTTSWQGTIPKEEIKEVIIKDKTKIIELMKTSSENFTNYAANVFNKIINESLNSNNPEVVTMRELFSSCQLVASSKEGGLLVFSEVDNMVKMAPNSKYKKYLESLFKRFIGVDYSIYTIQDHQYTVLKDELANPVVESNLIEEEVEEKPITKIDELFGDIIIEN